MEFDIGTLIYIIITIIAIVAGVAGKKKNPAGNTAPAGEEAPKGFFDKLEEQIGGFVDEAKESVNSVSDEIRSAVTGDESVMQQEAVQEDRFNYDTDFEEDYESEFNAFEGVLDQEQQDNLDLVNSEATRVTDEEDVMQVIDMDQPNHPDYFEVVKDFDLGTAVIYSTIINRKEY